MTLNTTPSWRSFLGRIFSSGAFRQFTQRAELNLIKHRQGFFARLTEEEVGRVHRHGGNFPLSLDRRIWGLDCSCFSPHWWGMGQRCLERQRKQGQLLLLSRERSALANKYSGIVLTSQHSSWNRLHLRLRVFIPCPPNPKDTLPISDEKQVNLWDAQRYPDTAGLILESIVCAKKEMI